MVGGPKILDEIAIQYEFNFNTTFDSVFIKYLDVSWEDNRRKPNDGMTLFEEIFEAVYGGVRRRLLGQDDMSSVKDLRIKWDVGIQDLE